MVGFIFVLIGRHYQPKTLKQSGRRMMTPEACSTKQELASTRKNAPILKQNVGECSKALVLMIIPQVFFALAYITIQQCP